MSIHFFLFVCKFISKSLIIYPFILCSVDQALAVQYEMDFQHCMMRMVDGPEKQMPLIEQTNKYKERLEYFSMKLAVDSALTMDPGNHLSFQISIA